METQEEIALLKTFLVKYKGTLSKVMGLYPTKKRYSERENE